MGTESRVMHLRIHPEIYKRFLAKFPDGKSHAHNRLRELIEQDSRNQPLKLASDARIETDIIISEINQLKDLNTAILKELLIQADIHRRALAKIFSFTEALTTADIQEFFKSARIISEKKIYEKLVSLLRQTRI